MESWVESLGTLTLPSFFCCTATASVAILKPRTTHLIVDPGGNWTDQSVSIPGASPLSRPSPPCFHGGYRPSPEGAPLSSPSPSTAVDPSSVVALDDGRPPRALSSIVFPVPSPAAYARRSSSYPREAIHGSSSVPGRAQTLISRSVRRKRRRRGRASLESANPKVLGGGTFRI
ncbi:hypothetical protein NL676_004793 [Syzygium grande]|nr:hypothetical protein NL676_004793 [Syzygium grande]